jgi:curli biogenesis system outer membrane secretion channel CsgG
MSNATSHPARSIRHAADRAALIPLIARARSRQRAAVLAMAGLLFTLAGCDGSKTPRSSTELGQGGSLVTGSAGPKGAQGADPSLVRCDSPVATLALAENPNGYIMSHSYQLPATPVPLIKLLAQQSGCFRVVDRGAGLRGTVQESELKDAGVLRTEGTVHKGKGYEAQYTIIPSLTFSEENAGRGLAGVIAAIPVLRDIGGLVGLVEQVKLKEAQVALMLTDNETTEQVASATGAARTTDLGLGGLVASKLGGGAGLGWSNTNEGKVIAAAFLDAHNKLVTQVRELQAKALPPALAVKTGGKAGHGEVH